MCAMSPTQCIATRNTSMQCMPTRTLHCYMHKIGPGLWPRQNIRVQLAFLTCRFACNHVHIARRSGTGTIFSVALPRLIATRAAESKAGYASNDWNAGRAQAGCWPSGRSASEHNSSIPKRSEGRSDGLVYQISISKVPRQCQRTFVCRERQPPGNNVE